jgi:release factor glutamine methyltransferase
MVKILFIPLNIYRYRLQWFYLYAMPTLSRAFYELKASLLSLYDEREAAAISHELLQHITGLDKTQRLIRKDDSLSPEQQGLFQVASDKLAKGCPIQYITGCAWFLGREYMVNESVLIPRPETEELVQWALHDLHLSGLTGPTILDIGTGSGCIPISLKLALPLSEVSSCDISKDALAIADSNAQRLSAHDIRFINADVLSPAIVTQLAGYDVIISNPPYIPVSLSATMHINVKEHEPAIALFVPDDDPFIFYKAIAAIGHQHLRSKGYIYCEIESSHGDACAAVFRQEGYTTVELRNDIHGNPRMLKAGN